MGDRRLTTGYSFHLQKAGAAVSWSTKKQPTAAISTSEAEYQTMAAVVQEALYLRSLLDEMGVVIHGPTVIKKELYQDMQESSDAEANELHQYEIPHCSRTSGR